MKSWNTMHSEAREAMMVAAAEAEETLRQHRGKSDDNAIEAMQERGLNVSDPDPAARQEWDQLVHLVWPRIRGSMVPRILLTGFMNC